MSRSNIVRLASIPSISFPVRRGMRVGVPPASLSGMAAAKLAGSFDIAQYLLQVKRGAEGRLFEREQLGLFDGEFPIPKMRSQIAGE